MEEATERRSIVDALAGVARELSEARTAMDLALARIDGEMAKLPRPFDKGVIDQAEKKAIEAQNTPRLCR